MGICVVIFSIPAQAATFTVTSTADSGAGSLRQAVLDANAGDTIVFDAATNGTPIILASVITIDKSLTITGNGSGNTSISGNTLVQIFDINTAAATVNLSGMTFTQGLAAANGGAIANIGTLHVQDSIFTLNDAVTFGGAIYNTGGLTIQSGTFVNNAAGPVFAPPTGTESGGAIYSTGTLTIKSSRLAENAAFMNGGGIYNTGTASIQTTEFSDNIAANNDGGAIYNDGNLTVLNGTFERNSAVDDGGAINNNEGTLVVSSSLFSLNTLTADKGGAISNDGGTVSITTSTFSNNMSHEDGGAIENDDNDSGTTPGSMTITLSTFTENQSQTEDGGAIFNSDRSTLTISDTTFSFNSAGDDGGALANEDSAILNINRVTFDQNEASDPIEGDGGAIINTRGSTLTVRNATFSGNTAVRDGGAIDNGVGGSTTSLTNVTLSANNAATGGNLFNDVAAGAFTINHTLVANAAGGGDCSGTITSTGFNLDTDGSCNLTGTGDLSNRAIALPALANNGGATQTINITGTIAQDTGGTSCLAEDQRTSARPGNNRCDIGAFEVYAPNTSNPKPSPNFNATVLVEDGCWEGNTIYGCIYDNSKNERHHTGGNPFLGPFEVQIRGYEFCLLLHPWFTPDGYTLNQDVARYVDSANCYTYDPALDWDVYRLDFAAIPRPVVEERATATVAALEALTTNTATDNSNTSSNSANANVLATAQPTADWAAYHAQQTATAQALIVVTPVQAEPPTAEPIVQTSVQPTQQDSISAADPTLQTPTQTTTGAVAPSQTPVEVAAEVIAEIQPTYTAMHIQVPLAEVDPAVDVTDGSNISTRQWVLLGTLVTGSTLAFGLLGGMAIRSILRRKEH